MPEVNYFRENEQEAETQGLVNRKHTSENVNEAVLTFLRLAKMIADTASLELVANGRAINEMKKVGILVASEKLSTASTRGSANAAAITAPANNIIAALKDVHLGFLTPSSPSPSSFSLAPSSACAFFVFCMNYNIIRSYDPMEQS